MSLSSENRTPNRLIHEGSPYLLQHAHNPVDWYPWGAEALNKAKEEDKLIIVSIGYSSCHWCHVMERECFENDEIAAMMNKHFINIKVDREERPDIDQIYMDALQSMNIPGGWPLNVFLTPDAKPFYGGTYFPPAHWMHLMHQITNGFKEHRGELEKSAEDFTRVLNYTEIQKYGLDIADHSFSKEDLELMYQGLERNFDRKFGGPNKAPKFPMPSIYLFLLRYYKQTKNEAALRHTKLTLDKMAMGGIYDQIGGGFARYSTDGEWFAPHFEKMLYDNGQLVTLYSEAYQLTKSTLYKEVVYQTIDFIKREMTNKEGGFYSALDADSEGVEGKFYIWTSSELKSLLGEEYDLFAEYYNVKEEGNWEHDFNILNRTLSDIAFANKHQLSIDVLKTTISRWNSLLLSIRNKRKLPGVDDKILTSWNAMMLKGLIDAYRAFDEEKFLELALQNATFICQYLKQDDRLFHSIKDNKASIAGFLDDYAFTINAFIAIYQATFNEIWLKEALTLSDYVINHFFDPSEDMFFFTSDEGEKLIARKKEIFDNVIPASNSIMAMNLFLLGNYYDNKNYLDLSYRMTSRVTKLLVTEPSYLSQWGCLYSQLTTTLAEVVISGKQSIELRKKLDKEYLPFILLAGTTDKSTLTLLEGREQKDSATKIYVCHNKTCKLPVETVEEAIGQL